MESIAEKAAHFMHLNIDSLVPEIDELPLIFSIETKFKQKLCNSGSKLD